MATTPKPMQWPDIVRRMIAGEELDDLLEQQSLEQRAWFVAYMTDEVGRPDLAAEYQQKMREIDLGISGAQATWHALSPAQRRVLSDAAQHGGRIEGIGKATMRNLCLRELMAWDGGAFDPEFAAVITERGRFVLDQGGK